jgi:hypothetical protein
VGRLAGLLGRHNEAKTDSAAPWLRRTAPAPGRHAALALLRLFTLTARCEQDAARDSLQQAPKRADDLDIPALAADSRRPCGVASY